MGQARGPNATELDIMMNRTTVYVGAIKKEKNKKIIMQYHTV
jgi:hypothetical protein